jgi:hypothetical protein
MGNKIKVVIRRKAENNPEIENEALLDTWLDDDEDLENEGKETKPGAAPDGKCKPERGDFACYMDSEGKRKKTPTKTIGTKPTKTEAGLKSKGKSDG